MSPRGKAKAKKDVGANGKERRVRESRNVKAASYKDLSDSDDDKPIQKRKKVSDSESMSEEEKPKRVAPKGRRASARSRKEEVSDSEEASDFVSSDESSGGDSRKRKKPARKPTRSTRASRTSYKDLSNSEEDSNDDEEVDSDSEKEKSPVKKGRGRPAKTLKKVKKDESSEEEEDEEEEAEAEEEEEVEEEEEEEEDENDEPNDSKAEKSAASKTSGEKAKDKKVDKEGSKKVGKEGPKKVDKEGSKKEDKEGSGKKVEKEESEKKGERPEHELSEEEEDVEDEEEEEEEEEEDKKEKKPKKKETDEKSAKKDKDEKSTKKEKDVKTTKTDKDEKTTDKDEKTTKTETDETATKMETDENDSKKRGRTGKASDDAADEESDDEPQTKKAKAADKPMLNKTESDFKSIDFTSNAKTKDGKEWNLKISSWNVAGLKALVKKNGLDFIKYENPDILCLQETKCSEKKLPPEAKVEGYHAYWLMGEKEGYAGVGILSKTKPLDVKYGVGKPEFDNEGRVITAEYEKFFLVNTYVPNAGQGLKSLPRRLEWDPVFRAYLKSLDEKKPVILCGDLNVAHSEIDLANPKTNTKSAGFTPQEREGMTVLLKEGFVDTFRSMYPDKTGAYSFWTYLSNSRSRNVGWRLDYFITSERFLPNVCDNVMRSEVFGSDHCPITLFAHV